MSSEYEVVHLETGTIIPTLHYGGETAPEHLTSMKEKPKVAIPTIGPQLTYEDLRYTVHQASTQGKNIDKHIVKAFLSEYFRTIQYACPNKWTSFKLELGKEDEKITPLNLITIENYPWDGSESYKSSNWLGSPCRSGYCTCHCSFARLPHTAIFRTCPSDI